MLASNPQNPLQQSLPSDFPTSITAGTTITVTDSSSTTLTGTLATATPPKSGSGTQPVSNGTNLTGQLSATDSTAVGSVQYCQATQNDTTNTLFAVHVQGAPANDTLTVSIGSVVVGTITTDANGNGGLVLSSNPRHHAAVAAQRLPDEHRSRHDNHGGRLDHDEPDRQPGDRRDDALA